MRTRTRVIRIAMSSESGFTLVETVIVLVIAGVLAAVALQSGSKVYEATKVEETKRELIALTHATVGNPALENHGVRSDFGYVGDVGSLPPNLAALNSSPGAYATWNGPYISNRFSQVTDDYYNDAWGTDYGYSGVLINSTGSGSTISGKLAASVDHLLLNQVSGTIRDRDGSPPGPIFKDSMTIFLTVPNGSGGNLTKAVIPDLGGYFAFDSIPIGNHDLTITYQPSSDTIQRFVSVLQNSKPYLFT